MWRCVSVRMSGIRCEAGNREWGMEKPFQAPQFICA
jgi:hypothetical protein